MMGSSIILSRKLLQVVRCCIEHAASVAKAFLTSNAVVIDIKELQPIIPQRKPNPMATSGTEMGHSFHYV